MARAGAQVPPLHLDMRLHPDYGEEVEGRGVEAEKNVQASGEEMEGRLPERK